MSISTPTRPRPATGTRPRTTTAVRSRSAAVATAGHRQPSARPSTVFAGLAYDAFDALATARFWAAALHVDVSPGATPAHAELTTTPGAGIPRLVFRQVTDGRPLATPLHLELATSDLEGESRRLQRLGARRLGATSDDRRRAMTLADPEGNAFELVAA